MPAFKSSSRVDLSMEGCDTLKSDDDDDDVLCERSKRDDEPLPGKANSAFQFSVSFQFQNRRKTPAPRLFRGPEFSMLRSLDPFLILVLVQRWRGRSQGGWRGGRHHPDQAVHGWILLRAWRASCCQRLWHPSRWKSAPRPSWTDFALIMAQKLRWSVVVEYDGMCSRTATTMAMNKIRIVFI